MGALCTLFLLSSKGHAGAIFATDRGVRPMGRAGAFVAGADDGQSVWMNPAGLSDAGSTLSIDAAVVMAPITYTRQSETRDADGVRRTGEFPAVTGSTAFVPIPSIVYTKVLSSKWTGALSLVIPYGPPRTFPATVNGQPAPQRYAEISAEGSALVILGGHASYKCSESFRIGAGLQVMVGTIKDKTVLQASLPDRLIAAPEAPDFDAAVSFSMGPIVSPSANAGAIWVPSDHFRFGASVQGPFYMYAPATISSVLPSSAVMRGGYQSGESATVSTWLPPSVRAGLEYRTVASGTGLRVEGTWVREFGSVFATTTVTPNNITINNLPVLPSPLPVPPVTVRNNTLDTDSFRLGAEYTHVAEAEGGTGTWQLRGGAQYNTRGVENKHTSVRIYGPEHVLVTLGVGYQVSRKITLDLMYAKALSYSLVVAPGEAAVAAETILGGNPTMREAHNGGKYEASLDVLGLGLRYAL